MGLLGIWALTAGAAWSDLRWRLIPNWWWGVGAAWLILGWCVGWWPWSTWLPLLITGVAYEIANAIRPQMGYGDIKWALLITGALGWAGFGLLALAHLLTPFVGTGLWLIRRLRGQRTPWNRQRTPWITVLWAGWTLAGLTLLATIG